MKKVVVVGGTAVFLIGMAVSIICGLRCWTAHDARYLSSFLSLEELRVSDVGGCTWETAFRQDGKDFVGIWYHRRKLPPQYLSRWFGAPYDPYLIFNANGRRVDKTSNYNDDHSFIHRWPALFPSIKSCKCGKGNSSATDGKRIPQIRSEESK